MSTHEDFSREEADKGGSERGFGIVFTVVFFVIGLWPLIDGGAPRAWALAIGILFLLMALARPALLAPLNRIWTKFGLLLNKIVNPVVLGLMYFVVITPWAIIGRLAGRDALLLKKHSGQTSYWIKRDPPGPDPQSMKHQF